MFKNLFTLVLGILLFSSAAFAQQATVSGLVSDGIDDTNVAGATVQLLLQRDSSLVKSTVTNSSGAFSFVGVPADSLLLIINTTDYSQYKSFFTLGSEDKNLGILKLSRAAKDLEEVIIVSKAPSVVQKGDTSQYSADQYKVNPDATVEDLIKKMPGIVVDRSGKVTAQGEEVKRVTIDGKEFFGDDASVALKNLPSSAVDKIQVFDRLSDQAQLTGFDDGNGVKAINIVTKAGIKNGQFGRVYAGYGTDDRYNAGGNVSFFNGDRRISLVGSVNNINQQNFASQDLLGVSSGGGGGGRGGGRGGGGGDNFTINSKNGISKTNAFGLNYSNKWGKKLTMSGSYFINNTTTDAASYINRETFTQPLHQFAIQNNISTQQNTNQRINARIEYKIDSNNSISLRPSLSFQKNNSNSLNDLTTLYEGGDSVNAYNGIYNTDRSGYQIGNELTYNHSFAKKGRSISLGLETKWSKNDGEYLTNGLYKFYNNGIRTDSGQNQFNDNNSDGRNIDASVRYTEPIGKKSQLQLNYSPSVQKNNADQQTFNFDGDKYTKFDTTLSNIFTNKITTQSGGITYRLNQDKDNQFSVGVNYQNTNLQSDRVFPTVTNVNQTFSNFLPNAFYRGKWGKYSNMRIFYRAYTNFPGVTQLQDVVNLSDPLRVSSGNPGLKQTNGNFLGSRYSYTNTKNNKSLFGGVFFQTAQDYISNATYIARQDSVIQQGIVLRKGSQLSKPVNLDGYRNLRSFLTYSMPLKGLKTNLNISGGFNYANLPGLVNNVSRITKNYSYNGGVTLASNISQYVDFNINYNINKTDARTTGGTISNNSYINQTTGLNLNLLTKNGWFLQNDVTNQTYTGLSAGLNQSFWLWNAGIGKKFLKKQAGELKLSVFDLLKQNQSISREITSNYIEDTRTKVLQQYFMLTFTYSLKNFGTPKASPSQERERPGGR